MNLSIKKWLYLIILSFIWGSSYILIKKGLIGLNPLQLGSLRIIVTTLILFIFGWSKLGKIPKDSWKWIALTGYFGTFFPTFLFAYAETAIDSSVAAVLNGMTPLFTLLIGISFFRSELKLKKLFGILIGFGGTLVLVSNEFTINNGPKSWYSFFSCFSSLLLCNKCKSNKI